MTARLGFPLLALLAGCGFRPSPPPEAILETASARLRSEDYTQALASWESGWKRVSAQPGSETYWRYRLLHAEILLELRKIKEAEHVLSEPPPPQWPDIQGRHLLLQAHVEQRMAGYDKAERLLNEAGQIAAGAGLAQLEGEIEFRRASVLARRGESEAAEELLRRLIQRAGEHGDLYLQGSALGNFGFNLMSAARYDEALTAFERARAVFEQTGRYASLGRVAGNMGWCYYRLGDFDRALAGFEQARAAFARIGNRFEEQLWLGNQGSVLLSRGDYTAAAEKYQKALQIAREIPSDTSASDWLTNLATARLEMGDLDAAEDLNRQSFELKKRMKDDVRQIYSINNSAKIAVKRGNLDEARRLFARAAAAESDDATARLDAYAGLAKVHADTGDRALAERRYRKALQIIETHRAELGDIEHRLSYLASLIGFYKDYVQFLMQTGRPDAALEAAESSRARLLAERAGMEPLASGETKAAAFQQLARSSRSVLLSYWLGRERSFLWAITGSRIAVHELPPESEIQPLVESYAALIQSSRDPLATEHPAGRRLFETLVAPARDALPSGSRVIIVPDGVLHALNFESLPVPGASPRYWIEDAQITLAPSLSLLSGGDDRSSTPDSMLLIGDPRGSGEDFPQLKFAAAEMDALPEAFPGVMKSVYRGADARPSVYLNARPARYGLIHFAAHAVANSQSPLDSAVILSGPAGQGKLFARQIMTQPLQARLVTISACRGAGAKVYEGEGLVGLAWAFLHAGASNVIAGLWNVDDRSTADLMQLVYHGMAAGKTPAEALRDAKRTLIRSNSAFRKPYYWAPFQLYRRSIS